MRVQFCDHLTKTFEVALLSTASRFGPGTGRNGGLFESDGLVATLCTLLRAGGAAYKKS
jgi:hypothetical protein